MTNKRYRIAFTSIRGTHHGRALDMLYSGLQVESNDEKEITDRYMEFKEFCELITSHTQGAVFGVLNLIDRETAKILRGDIIASEVPEGIPSVLRSPEE